LKKPLRIVAAALMILTGVGFVLTVYATLLTNKDAAERDFISYWAAGQLLVRGQGPYDFQAVGRLEHAAGRDPAEPLLIMRNPPVAFALVLPLGFAGPKIALIVWLAFLMGVLSLSVWLLGQLNGRSDEGIHLLGYAFAPALVCLMAGQFGIFMLLGVVVFLYLQPTRPLLAGAALSLLALKPHYFLPFGVALLLWSVTSRSYRVLAGFCMLVATSCAVAYRLDPHAWAQYAQMVHFGGALNEIIPELSVQLRLVICPRAVWIQFVPEAAACLWAVWYFLTRRFRWSWKEHGLLLLLVGAVCTPYGWFFDESVLFPAVLAGMYRAIDSKRPLWPVIVFCAAALVESLAGVQVISRYYLWTTPAWLCWYLYATGRLSLRAKPAWTSGKPDCAQSS
jgi:hypothetical protein